MVIQIDSPNATAIGRGLQPGMDGQEGKALSQGHLQIQVN